MSEDAEVVCGWSKRDIEITHKSSVTLGIQLRVWEASWLTNLQLIRKLFANSLEQQRENECERDRLGLGRRNLHFISYA